jgi:DNA adenine methylase
MRIASPLRYPGGKAFMFSVLRDIREANQLNGHAVAEPFAGGAGASISLLSLRETHEVHINDLDKAIFSFWYSAVHDADSLTHRLEDCTVSIEEWRRWRGIYRSKEASRLDLGFAAFYLNRCNRSGIIKNGGPIGGIDQSGRWKIDARFNKENLAKRLEWIAQEAERITVSNLDGMDFIESLDPDATLFFIDPPYFNKGPALYLDVLDHEYHMRLAEKLQCLDSASWVLTYDDCTEIRELYENWASIVPFSLRYTASTQRIGREILITPKWVRLPEYRNSATMTW